MKPGNVPQICYILATRVAIYLLQLYMYQLFRSLAYIHSLGICHRDIKPQNLLLDPQSGILKLCDFGSAKHLVEGEPNVSYICSRYYRAPELIFGATDYTTKIGKKFMMLRIHNKNLASVMPLSSPIFLGVLQMCGVQDVFWLNC